MTFEHLVELFGVFILAALGGLIWLVRLEGRVNLLDRVLIDHLNASTGCFDDISAHLSRVEEKVDRIALRCAAFSHFHNLEATRRADGDSEP